MDKKTEQNNSSAKKYIVLRNERPISNEELSLEEAQEEIKRWENILKRWPDGSKVRMEEVKK